MGLIRILGDVVGAGLGAAEMAADSVLWREYFVSGDMSNGVLMKRAEKVVTDKSRNTRSDDNLISSGSGIDVQVGQCMLIIDNGRIVDFCTEPGRYQYDASTQPSLLCGENKGWKAFGKEILNQWSTGGQRFSTQRVYFINMGEQINQPIKWGFGDIPFHHTTIMRNGTPPIEMDITLKGNGQATIMISDPIKFFNKIGSQKVGGDNDGLIRITDEGILSTLKSGITDNIFEALQNIGFEEPIPYSAIRARDNGDKIKNSINVALSNDWAGLRGFEVCDFTVNTIVPIKEDIEKIQGMQQSFNMGANMNAAIYDIQKGYSEGARAAGNNAAGAVNGFMGMGMAGAMGGFGQGMGQMQPQQMNPQDYTQNPYDRHRAPQAAPAAPAQPTPQGAVVAAPIIDVENETTAAPVSADTWTCECGHTNTGKFCMECGNKKPVPQPKADGPWVCTCGTQNTGKFCMECGSKRPEVKKVLKCDKCGWMAPAGVEKVKFCPECGDIVTEADYQ